MENTFEPKSLDGVGPTYMTKCPNPQAISYTPTCRLSEADFYLHPQQFDPHF